MYHTTYTDEMPGVAVSYLLGYYSAELGRRSRVCSSKTAACHDIDGKTKFTISLGRHVHCGVVACSRHAGMEKGEYLEGLCHPLKGKADFHGLNRITNVPILPPLPPASILIHRR